MYIICLTDNDDSCDAYGLAQGWAIHVVLTPFSNIFV